MIGKVNNRHVAALLYEVADLLEIGGVKFKPAVYRRAAHSIESLPEEIAIIAERGKLDEIPGVGTHIATKLNEILETGNLGYLERLRQDVGLGMRELTDIWGIGPKKAVQLHRDLGIDTAEHLEMAAIEGKIRSLPGFGEKSEKNILRNIITRRGNVGRSHLGSMLPVAEKIQSTLASLPEVHLISIAGSLRRMKETIGDIDILAASPESERVMTEFVALPEVSRVLVRGPTKSSIVLESGVQVDLRVVEEGQYWTALQYFTGSKDHNIALRRRALDRGWSLSEYGVKEAETGKNLEVYSEEELYHMLGLPYIEPELRENTGEIEAAEIGTLPRIVPYHAIKGDLHVHPDWSEGKLLVQEVAAAARNLGYEYIAICDHYLSPGTDIGVTEERIAHQREEIDWLNREPGGIVVLQGIECTTHPDGSLVLQPGILKNVDLVIASHHSELGMHSDEVTPQVLAVIENEQVDILGYPTVRLLLQREPSDIDLPAIFKAASEQHVAFEICGYPSRLELSDTHCREAKKYGVKFSISSDAHAGVDLSDIRLGIAIARRKWLTADEIINTRPLSGLQEWLGK